ncbi:MAG TPA: hypothetical protein VD928_01370 [Candidatus Paceibacterota bacterium]|nr:hypothetical protein [Candidatus Paceibacterota bacterium]
MSIAQKYTAVALSLGFLLFVPATTNAQTSPLPTTPSLSPYSCLWANQFNQNHSPHTFRGRDYILHDACEPRALIARLIIATQSTIYNASVRTRDRIRIDKDCGFLGFNCKEKLKVTPASTVEFGGSLPPFIRPGDSLAISWQCQPFQDLLWVSEDYNWWGVFGDDDDTNIYEFAYASRPRGIGFDTGGQLSGSITVSPTNTTSYTLNCGATAYESPEITVNVDNPLGSISASPSQVNPGGSTRITWLAQNVKPNSCTVIDSTGRTIASNANASPAQGISSGPLSAASSPVEYTLRCIRYNDAPISWKSNRVDVVGSCATTYNSANPQLCSFNATSPVLEGGEVDLRWYCPATSQTYRLEASTNGGTSWTLLQSRSVPSSGGERTYTIADGNGPIENTTYRLTCISSANGNSMGSGVTVVNKPLFSLTATPTSVPLGASTLLRWSSQFVNQNSCRLTQNTSSSVIVRQNNNAAGRSVTPSILPSTYHLTCRTPASDAGRTAHPRASVTVYEPGTEPTLDVRVVPGTVRKDGSTIVFWSGTNLPSSCTVSTSPSIAGFPRSGASTATGNSTGISVGPITQTTIITVACAGVSDSANVSLVPIIQEI